MSNGFVDKIGEGIRTTSLNKIITAYPELNKDWLLTGAGEMLNQKQSINMEDTPPLVVAPTGETAALRELIDELRDTKVYLLQRIKEKETQIIALRSDKAKLVRLAEAQSAELSRSHQRIQELVDEKKNTEADAAYITPRPGYS